MFLILRKALLSNPELSGMITGVYPGFVPSDKKLPAISAFIVSEGFTESIDGSGRALIKQEWQINIVSTSMESANAIYKQVVLAMHKQEKNGVYYAYMRNRQDVPPQKKGDICRVIIDLTLVSKGEE